MKELTAPAVLDALAACVAVGQDIPGQAFAACIVDAGGHVVGSLRHPGAAVSAGHRAETQARTAVYLRVDTGGVPPDSPYVPALTSGLPYPINVFPGGLLILDGGRLLGALGVGGSTDPRQDLAVAQAVHETLVNAL